MPATKQNIPATNQTGTAGAARTMPATSPTPSTSTPSASARAQSAASKAEATASRAAADASSKAKQAAAQAKQAAMQTADEVTNQAERVHEQALGAVRERADALADGAKSRTNAYISSFGRALDAAAGSLEGDGMSGTAGYVRAAANGLNEATREVDGIPVSNLTHRVEDYVRERPMLTVGVLALAGFAVASMMQSRR